MIQPDSGIWYRARAFAELAGVTVRALHHYDRLGLLKPRSRSSRGYRLYQARDLERLERITALRFLGMPLARIARVLGSDDTLLGDELDRQRLALLGKRRRLDLALRAIEAARLAPTAESLRRIIRTIAMQNNTEWMMKYYSPAAQGRLARRAADFTPEMQEQISEQWKQYYRDLSALEREGDPEGTRAAELAERHRALVAAFTGEDAEIEAGLRALYRDHENWPDAMRERLAEYRGA